MMIMGGCWPITADEEREQGTGEVHQVMDDGTGNGADHLPKIRAQWMNENGLPIYYTDGKVVTKDETWITDDSTDPYGNPESTGAYIPSHVFPLALHPSGGAGTI